MNIQIYSGAQNEFPPVEWVNYIFGIPCLYSRSQVHDFVYYLEIWTLYLYYVYSDTIYHWWVLKFEFQGSNLDTYYIFSLLNESYTL